MNLVQFKTNIHEFERCERDVILFILDYLTEKYIHRGGGGGGGGIKKVELREFKYQERIVKGRVKFVSQNYNTPAKFACPVQTAKHLSMVLQVKHLCPLCEFKDA